MLSKGIHACLFTAFDPHISEYPPERFRSLAILSGFSGSAGTVIVTEDFAGLWTDSRYFIQAKQELQGSGYELVKLGVPHAPEFIDWLANSLKKGQVLATDFQTLPASLGTILNKRLAGLEIQLWDLDPIESLWGDRPAFPLSAIRLLKTKDCGKSAAEKIFDLQNDLRIRKLDYLLLSSLDDLAWIFNMRGSDVPFTPVVLAHALFSPEESFLFLDERKISETQEKFLKEAKVFVLPYHQLEEELKKIPKECRIQLDPKKVNFHLHSLLSTNWQLIEDPYSSQFNKSIKNTKELENIREVMLKDGVAVTKFIYWLYKTLAIGPLSEYKAAQILFNFRSEQSGFQSLSFESIIAFKENAALPHYHPSENNSKMLSNRGLLLIDSGGQYLYGTTDVTRTLPLGKCTQEEKEDYTLVLKALIEGSLVRFPKGTRGYQLDAIIRNPLWQYGLNYGHGTGHGVGYFLNVHEGPQNISPDPVPVPIELNMVTTIEPAVYRRGKHGVRIENQVLTIPFQKI